MYVKQFEFYLADLFVKWITPSIEAGYRYQFKSPDADNGVYLLEAFTKISVGSIRTKEVELPYVLCGNTKLVIVLHGEDGVSGFTEHYITWLRDSIAGRDGLFGDCALLVIHNSTLESIINSSQDVASPSYVWHPAQVKEDLEKIAAANSSGRDLFHCLIEAQYLAIREDQATVFGFSAVYRALVTGVPNFQELGLFNDPLILRLNSSAAQIRKRLEENRELRKEISFEVEFFSDQLEDHLKDFSQKFIRQHFIDNIDWQNIDFDAYQAEIEKNKKQQLIFDGVSVSKGTLSQRAKSASKAGRKEYSLLIEVPVAETEIVVTIDFLGSDLQKDQVILRDNKNLDRTKSIEVRSGRKNCKAMVNLPFDGNVTYFSLELKREASADQYKFKCVMLRSDLFFLDPLRNIFRVEPNKAQLTIQTEDDQLRIASDGDVAYSLVDTGEKVDGRAYQIVDLRMLANVSDIVDFAIIAEQQELRINVEGAAATENVSVPFLLDKARFSKFFKDDSYNVEYNRKKSKLIVDNTEIAVVGVRQQLLQYEARLIDEGIVGLSSQENVSLSDLALIDNELGAAYSDLFNYYIDQKTLPSLVSWSPHYQVLVKAVVDKYEVSLSKIAIDTVLTSNHRRLLQIGFLNLEEKERISPLHPLVLSYYANLVQRIQADESGSFSELPDVTLERLSAHGLLPFVAVADSGYARITAVKENPFWLDVVPELSASYGFIRRLVRDKLREFASAYSYIFSGGRHDALIVNAINLGEAYELLLGILDNFKEKKEQSCAIHVNFYDDVQQFNAFDKFSELTNADEIRQWFGLQKNDNVDIVVDLLRSRLTYSKLSQGNGKSLTYAHLAFFRNTAPVNCIPVSIDSALSGVLCDSLIAGEASEIKSDAYFTAFGLRNVEIAQHQPLRIAKLIGALMLTARQNNTQYLGNYGIALAISTEFKELLNRSYDSALWTTIIDPKVTLEFFSNQKDVVLIHYSDQYTSSASYDAITVTKQVELFQKLLGRNNLISEFNAFNGEWLLKMLTANENTKKERLGIIGAYKFISALLCESGMCWIPLSVAEMIRVSGNVGLRMSDSEFSRNVQGYSKGAISDDVLFVGFKERTLYILPLEVKTGARPNFKHAELQVLELRRYLIDEILGPQTLAGNLYRGLFVRQILMQVEKYRLYQVFNSEQLAKLLDYREWWLRGQYLIGDIKNYPKGFVVAHLESESCLGPNFVELDEILQIELPYGLLDTLIDTPSADLPALRNLLSICSVPEKFRLGSESRVANVIEESVANIVQNDNQKASAGLAIDSKRPSIASPIGPTGQDHKSATPLRILFGVNTADNSPLYWEPTNTAKFMNTNSGIIGTMGTGKTQFTKSVIAQIVHSQIENVDGYPIGMLIFDYKSDYVDQEFCNATGAKKYQLHRLPYNPLSLYGDTPLLPVHTARGFAETMALAFGLGQKQQLKLRKLIMDAYESAGITKSDPNTWNMPAPTIADVWALFSSAEKVEEDSLYAALETLVEMEIFESDASKVCSLYDLIDGITVIELAKFPGEIQSLVVALTLDLFYSQMQKKGKPIVRGDLRQVTKLILVDEADNFMSKDFPSLRKILKEGREYGVGVLLSTQDITHFKTAENDYSSYILTWIVHRVAQIRNQDIKAIFNKEDKNDQEHLMRSIRELEKHFSLYIDGDKRVKKMRDKAFWELIENNKFNYPR